MSGRSPQDASEHVVQNRVHAEKRQRETVRDANRRARFEKKFQELALRTLKRKTPGWASEGVRVPRRSGRPISSEADQSWRVPLSRRWQGLPQAIPQPFRSVHASASRWKRDGADWLAVENAGFIRNALENSGIDGSAAAMGAHVTPVVCRLQTFFSHSSAQRTNGTLPHAGGVARRLRHAVFSKQKKQGDRSRPAWKTRIDVAITASALCR